MSKQKWIVTSTYQTKIVVTVEADSQLEAIKMADQDWADGKTNAIETNVPHSQKPWRAKRAKAGATT